MAQRNITRVTLFKVPNEADQQKLLDKYREMPKNAKRDGKPYIVSLTAGRAFNDQRAQGYTIGVVTVFASKEDFEYYDTACPAHNELKAVAKEVHKGNLMLFMENIFDESA